MFSTDNLFFLVLFIVPGVMYLLYNRFIRLTPRIEKDEGLRLSGVFVFSTVVFFLMVLFFGEDYEIFTQQETIYDDRWLLIKIIGLNLVISSFLSVIWGNVGRHVITFISNLFYKGLKKPTTSENESVWNDIFETNKYIDKNCMVVCVENNGVKSYGVIKTYSEEITGKMEFVLVYSTEIQTILNADAEKSEEDKVFPEVEYVYLNIDAGLKITFYNTNRYRALLE